MVFWMPPEAAAAWAASQQQVPASGAPDSSWYAWQDVMRQYQRATNAGGLPKLNFWIVVSLPGGSYSDKIEWHSNIPMLVPTSGSGELTGLARTWSELEQVLAGDKDNVHLTYKVKIQGQQAWRDLLEWLAKHDCLEKE